MRGQEFGKVYRKRDMIMGILKCNKKDQSIRLERINASSELAVNSSKFQKKRKLEEIVAHAYHKYLNACDEAGKTELLQHRPGVGLGIALEEGKSLPQKEIHALA